MSDFRRIKPVPSDKIDFALPGIENAYLNNGIKLVYVNKPNLPITQFEIILESGSSYDPPEKQGLSYLTAMLMDEGAAEYNSLELSDEIEKLGSILSISADKDAIYVAMLSMSQYLERSVELMSKIISSPNFKQNDFEREKVKLLTRILQTNDNPAQLANNVFDKLVYAGSYYSHPVIGYSNSVNTFTNDEVKEFYFNTVLNSQVTILAVSSEPKDKILEQFNKHLSFDKSPNIINKQSVPVIKPEPTGIFIVDSNDAPQTEIRIGHITGKRSDGEFFSRLIMNAILGGQFSSRINLNLREDKGFTYGAHSYFAYNKNAGEFSVSTSVDSQVTAKAVEEIVKELKGIQKGVNESELEFSKSFLMKRFPAMFETYLQIANNLGTQILYDLDKDYFDNYLENLERVQIEDVNRAANEYVYPEKSIILLTGNKNEIIKLVDQQFEYQLNVLDNEGNLIG